jgi:hypothetical protein
MRPMRAVMLVAGIIVGLIALGLVVGGGVLTWAHTHRDAEGYYTFDAHPYGTPGYAITSEELDLGARPNDWFPSGIATLRFDVTSSTDVFVGVAPRADVETYLEGVAHSVIASIDARPFRVTYRQVTGTAVPAPPTEQDFWAASVSGSGDQTLTWDLEKGSWTLVVMNADASRGVDVQVATGVKSGLLLPIGIGMIALGLLAAAGATALIVSSSRGKRPASSVPPPARPDQIPTP